MKMFCAVPILLLCGISYAQREVPMPSRMDPEPRDAVITGNKLSRTLTCEDRVRVYIRGNGNEVQVYGNCGIVRVQGSHNFVWLDHEGQVAVEGDSNVVYLRTSTTRVSNLGTGNRYELRH